MMKASSDSASAVRLPPEIGKVLAALAAAATARRRLLLQSFFSVATQGSAWPPSPPRW